MLRRAASASSRLPPPAVACKTEASLPFSECGSNGVDPDRISLNNARNLMERFSNKIKQCRRVATHYDKLAANYLAFVQLASIRLWLRVNAA